MKINYNPVKTININFGQNVRNVSSNTAEKFSAKNDAGISAYDIDALAGRYAIDKSSFDKISYALTPEISSIIQKLPVQRMGCGDLLRAADVIRRREHTEESIKPAIDDYDGKKEKLFNTLEFKNFDEVKDITLETYKTLNEKKKKDFLNGVISQHFYGTQKCCDNLPDMAIFDSLKKIKFPEMPDNLFGKEFKEYKTKNEETKADAYKAYADLIAELVKEIPRGKENLPQKPSALEKDSTLIIKPPFTDSVSEVETHTENIEGYEIEVGNLPKDKHFMIHNLSADIFPKLEALLLTDPDAILCTGYSGGAGLLKAGNNRPGVIVSPKTMKDLFIQGRNDMDSGYGAVKNSFNIQHKFLTPDNEANNYLPGLIKEKLSISDEEYNERMQKLADAGAKYISDIKDFDEEMYEAVKDISDNAQMFEGIMHPDIEAVVIPEGCEITPHICEFASKYDIPVLYSKN